MMENKNTYANRVKNLLGRKEENVGRNTKIYVHV